LDATKKQQRILDEADFVNQVIASNKIVSTASSNVMKGVTTIDLLSVQRSIDNLEKVFYSNGIRDEVISPTSLVGPLLDTYSPAFTSALSNSAATGLPLDTVFKVQDLSGSLDYLGSVTMNLGFSL